MSKRDFLLEIGLEEMPARFVPQAVDQLQEKVVHWMEERRIRHTEVRSYATPRRLALWIKEVDELQEDQVEEAKGPAKKIALDSEGNWTKAAEGFARGQEATVEQLYFKEVNGIEYVFITKETKGTQTEELLPQLAQLIQAMNFPKNMRWGTQDLKFVRPIRWLMALFGETIIPFQIAGVSTGNETYGHRFLGKKISISSPETYERQLLAEYVITDAKERKQAIRSQLSEIEEHQKWVIPIDEDLLEEITYLVEYPTALFGEFDQSFLNIPQEVLITSMKEHQRYFPVKNQDGELLSYFVTVRNGGVDPSGTVAKGNEKVLRARLADAQFFYEEDKKQTIPASLSKLGHVVFHEELGTIADKVNRIRSLASSLGSRLEINEVELKATDRTAELCKFDLVSQMVYEFPELQGRMGQEYARLAGETQEVAKGIYEHYMPRFAGDVLPQTQNGSIVSVADKLDTIVGCFSIGIIPTGSQDPYGLRRQATGIVQILLQQKWSVSLGEIFAIAIKNIKEAGLLKKSEEVLLNDLNSFFQLRIKNAMQDQGISYDIIDAVSEEIDIELFSLFNKAQILKEKTKENAFKGLVDAFTRVHNLAQKAELEPSAIAQELFEHNVENELYGQFISAKETFTTYAEQKNWDEAFEALTALQLPIEDFFENVMVMSDDEAIRLNRLALLKQISDTVFKFADFSRIVFSK
ncbi:glycine--tRNA ligase subunit beta [Bacillus horti]|uniref:Glycine--tRNA ligase beta subunit n=1 Tax=Caldalkalibacillus horti TaxID=77523 RepID=A0ABT9W4A5_9BACI|nr:glycine--tRNA ligase subunit beta [Bacillus horti]MDQ0168059.1 glycyl-tRNA synthetase beta chain [Bacillus horti]